MTATSLLLPVSAGTNQCSENDRAVARVARIQRGQVRSVRKTSRAVAVYLTSAVAAIRSDTDDEVARTLTIYAECARISQAHLFSARLAFTRDSAHAVISLRIHADERADNFTGAGNSPFLIAA